MFSKALVLAPLVACVVSSVSAAPAEAEKRQLDGISLPDGVPTDILSSLAGVTDIGQITSALGTAIPSDAISQVSAALATASLPDLGSAVSGVTLPSDISSVLGSLLPSGVDIGQLTSLIPSGVSIPTDAAGLSSLLGSASITDAGQVASILATATAPAGSASTQANGGSGSTPNSASGSSDNSGNTNGNNDSGALGTATPTVMLATIVGGSLLGAFLTV
ncbi:hypothetical protein K435DRAFT_842984 [Dendrothele bispora CBS 962.96]|uniref:Uncharacterized protein n=1 Tax=Dendrothele bispora (strain CBS 962.96) TaxID=1314807 RepID=A0A4S8LBL2_DENBC|nr:hypothetical protein K435DRAFT_842984 [Dendrothele bispora CBS 962.96]